MYETVYSTWSNNYVTELKFKSQVKCIKNEIKLHETVTDLLKK